MHARQGGQHGWVRAQGCEVPQRVVAKGFQQARPYSLKFKTVKMILLSARTAWRCSTTPRVAARPSFPLGPGPRSRALAGHTGPSSPALRGAASAADPHTRTLSGGG